MHVSSTQVAATALAGSGHPVEHVEQQGMSHVCGTPISGGQGVLQVVHGQVPQVRGGDAARLELLAEGAGVLRFEERDDVADGPSLHLGHGCWRWRQLWSVCWCLQPQERDIAGVG